MNRDCLKTTVSLADLEALLKPERPLLEKSSVGRMRDSYGLQLCSLGNLLKYLSNDDLNEFMFLLSCALQEEVIRNPLLSRPEGLMKVVLGFRLSLHYFDMSSVPRAQRVTQRFISGRSTAMIFAEDSTSPRMLHSV
jgi:hypothetical protein